MLRNPPWSRDELILALDTYFTYGHNDAAQHETLSQSLRQLNAFPDAPDQERFRNASGAGMKLANFAAIDPAYKGAGLAAYGQQDEAVFHEFVNDREQLHQLAAAIRANAGKNSPTPPPPVEDLEAEAAEGAVLLRSHLARERNPALAKKRKAQAMQQHGKLTCEVCGMTFPAVYGPIGDGFIECHHRTPLSKLAPGTTTKLQDLALVCANCHRMLHRGGGQTIAALKAQLKA